MSPARQTAIIILRAAINYDFSLPLNIDSCVAQARNRIRYYSPSRLTLDVHCSPKFSQFMTVRSISELLAHYQNSQAIDTNPAVACYF
jgi:hypothetical protein